MCSRKGFVIFALIFLLVLFAASLSTAYEGDGVLEAGENKADELRRATQNPMADLISLPIQNNTGFNYGPLDKTQNVTNIQPVIPFKLNEDWQLISRTIAPLINQPEFIEGQDSTFRRRIR